MYCDPTVSPQRLKTQPQQPCVEKKGCHRDALRTITQIYNRLSARRQEKRDEESHKALVNYR